MVGAILPARSAESGGYCGLGDRPRTGRPDRFAALYCCSLGDGEVVEVLDEVLPVLAAECRGDRWYAVIYEGIDPATGRERRTWLAAGADRADVERLAARLAAERNGRNSNRYDRV